jgi:hypothetical protein
VIHQLKHFLMRNVYDHLVKEFSNPTRLQATGETYAEVKDEIVKFEASLCDGELDRNKDIAGYDPNSKRDHDYDFQLVAKANRRKQEVLVENWLETGGMNTMAMPPKLS